MKQIPRPLMVIVVPPNITVNGWRLSDTYDVVVGDCVMPGYVVVCFDNAHDADSYALAYGAEHGMRVLPLERPS